MSSLDRANLLCEPNINGGRQYKWLENDECCKLYACVYHSSDCDKLCYANIRLARTLTLTSYTHTAVCYTAGERAASLLYTSDVIYFYTHFRTSGNILNKTHSHYQLVSQKEGESERLCERERKAE